MEKVCPICNALEMVRGVCPKCGKQLKDGGALKDYFGPYSPYITSSIEDAVYRHEDYCIHLLYCSYCRYDVRKGWKYLKI